MAVSTPYDINFTTTESPINKQADIYGNLNTGYANAIAGQATVPSLVTKYNEMFQVPQLQQAYNQGMEQYDNLGASIRAIPQDISQRSQESILTQGQKNRMVQAEQAPLLEQQGILGTNVTRLGQNLGTAQQNAGTMITAEQAQQTKELSPWLKQYDTEQVLSAMRMTGWTTENQMEFERLVTNAQMGFEMSENEKNRMHELAMQENEFNAQLEQIKETGNQNRLTKKSLPDLGTLYSSMFG